jgi:hypothetical protein
VDARDVSVFLGLLTDFRTLLWVRSLHTWWLLRENVLYAQDFVE